MKLESHVVNYRGKRIDALNFFEHLGMNYVHLYNDYLSIALSAQSAFDYVIHYQVFSNINLDNAFNLETDLIPAKETILKEYSDIKKFCIFYRLSYNAFCRILKKYPEANLRQALNHYMTEDTRSFNTPDCYVFYGVHLEAICLKYQMDYRFCQDCLSKGMNLQTTIQKALACSPLFSHDASIHLQELIPFIVNLSFNEFKQFLCQTNYSEELLDCIIFYRYRYSQIMDALNVYCIVDFLEHGWEEFFGKEIQALHRKSRDLKEFTHEFQNLRKQAQIMFLDCFGLSSDEFHQYYQEYYNDYVLVSNKASKIWGYNRRKIYTSLE